ncbi:MAG: tyrosine-protein phosphatase [Parachlamydiaceae bacterium]|nr:tyrosine-protein phosphatase [Parachlamydiaceae bacterium]
MKISASNSAIDIVSMKDTIKKYLPTDKRIYAIVIGIFSLVSLAYILKDKIFKSKPIVKEKTTQEKIADDFLEIKKTAAEMTACIKDIENITEDEFIAMNQLSSKLINDRKIVTLKHPENPKENEKAYCENFRFKNIECPQNTILPLRGANLPIAGKNPTAEDRDDFLHANEMNICGEKFIAGQYPVHHELFWTTIKDRVNVIVDLTSKDESKSTNTQFKSYAIDWAERKFPSGLAISCVACIYPREEDHIFYKLVIKEDGLKKEYTRLHYNKWEDKKGVKDIAIFTKFVDYVNHISQISNGGLFIHCTDGVGRTGTLGTCLVLAALIDDDTIETKEELKTIMFESIVEGRLQRGHEYVQTLEQLQTIWKFATGYLDARIAKIAKNVSQVTPKE